MSTYYKVVRKLWSGKLVSSQLRVKNPGCIVYKIGEWVHAHKRLEALGYGPLVFRNLESAITFANMYKHVHIGSQHVFECEISEVYEMKRLIFFNRIRALIKGDLTSTGCFSLMTPFGSVMVKSVKLIKEELCSCTIK